MFKNCEDLITTPTMFSGITNISMNPRVLGFGCFEMFMNCTNLINAPIFNAPNLSDPLINYYSVNTAHTSMFENCTSL